MAKPPRSLTFTADIAPVLQAQCVNCHSAANTNGVLPPVFYDPPAAGEDRDVYTDVRARANFADPEESLLLTKPSGRDHNGGTVAGFDPAGDHSTFDTFEAWILEGAVK